MRKLTIFLCLSLFCMMSLFALGSQETPANQNVYTYFGFPFLGAGYEFAIGNYFSLGTAVGVNMAQGFIFEFQLKPRVYFNSALEKFFIGANFGYCTGFTREESLKYYGEYYESAPYRDVFIGANTGYKFVFGSGQGGFSMEPSIGIDYFIADGRPIFNGGVSLGYAFGGKSRESAPQPATRTTTPSDAQRNFSYPLQGSANNVSISADFIPVGIIFVESVEIIDALGNHTGSKITYEMFMREAASLQAHEVININVDVNVKRDRQMVQDRMVFVTTYTYKGTGLAIRYANGKINHSTNSTDDLPDTMIR